MKLILSFICLLFATILFSQEKSVEIDKILLPYVKEFIKDGSNRGVDVTALVELDSIKIESRLTILGYQGNNNVYIHPFVLEDRLMTRAVLYHELFHAFGIKHTNDIGFDLMSGRHPIGFTYAYYIDDELWNKVLDHEFDKLK